MVVPVAGAQVKFVASKKASVQLRVEVLGYAINGEPINVRGLPPTQIAGRSWTAGETLVARSRHRRGRPAQEARGSPA